MAEETRIVEKFDKETIERFKLLDSLLSYRFSLDVGVFYDMFVEQRDCSDWDFVMKVHSFIQSLLIESLVLHSGKEDRRSLFIGLPVLREKAGKTTQVTLLMKMGIIDHEDEQFIRLVLDMRSRFVSRLALVHMDLAYYFFLDENRMANRRKSIIDALLLRQKRTQGFLMTAMRQRNRMQDKVAKYLHEIVNTYPDRRSIDPMVRSDMDQLIDSQPRLALLTALEALTFLACL